MRREEREVRRVRYPARASPVGSVAAAISNAVVRLLVEYTGRGLTKARRLSPTRGISQSVPSR
jgi:hypothetical protein